MALPSPSPGLVIRYAFLWREQAARGREEGDKDRPCAVVLTTQDVEGDQIVVVLPVTHAAPRNHDLAVELSRETKRRLGLDDERSWIVLTDANRFVWPGPDLRPRVTGDASSVTYGYLPRRVFLEVRDKFVRALEARLAGVVRRTD